MRTILLASAALAMSACGDQTAAPVDAAPAASETSTPDAHATAPAMDANMMAADAADDANTAETPDGYMFHTDLAKTENVHLPTAPGASWTATVIDPTQAEVSGATDEKMADGSTHHVVQVKFLKRDVIARVKFERRDSPDAGAPVAETRTVNFMVH